MSDLLLVREALPIREVPYGEETWILVRQMREYMSWKEARDLAEEFFGPEAAFLDLDIESEYDDESGYYKCVRSVTAYSDETRSVEVPSPPDPDEFDWKEWEDSLSGKPDGLTPDEEAKWDAQRQAERQNLESSMQEQYDRFRDAYQGLGDVDTLANMCPIDVRTPPRTPRVYVTE